MIRFQLSRRSQVARQVVAFAFTALAFAGSSMARADFPFPPSPREVHREIHGLVHDVLRTLDRIPVQIYHEQTRPFEAFYVGNVYFAPHRHMHATYNFPVWIDGSVDYRPYVYCNSRLYGSYPTRPQFWTGWGVASQGSWCGHHHAYYPNAHACFRPQRRSNHGSHHGPHYGNGYGSGYNSGYNSGGYGHGSGYGNGHNSHQGPRAYRNDGRGSHGSREGSYNGSRHGSRSGGHGRGKSEHRHDRNCHHGDGRNYR